MNELRLVPAALTVWGLTMVIIVNRNPIVAILVLVVVAGILHRYDRGQALVTLILGAVAVTVTTLRVIRCDATTFSHQLYAVAVGTPQHTRTGGWIQHMSVPRYPTTIPVLFRSEPAIAPGSTVLLEGKPITTDGWALNHVMFTVTDWRLHTPPGHLATWIHWVRTTFHAAVAQHSSPEAAALIPAMVLGDSSAQTAEFKADFIATGLAHLSAVSGANVTIITTTALLLCARFPPVVRTGAAAGALVVFVAVVGLEPSVLRAAATGIIGLVAVASSRTKPPIHVLAITVIAALCWDSALATHYGFILSVLATAGILTLYPMVYRAFATTAVPALIARALSVAIAAQLITMPVVAIMNHHISLVAIPANVLAAPAVAPITTLGLVAVVLSLLPGGLEVIPLSLINPLAQWIINIAATGARMPSAVIELPSAWAPVWALVLALWIIYFVHTGRMHVLGILCAVILVIPSIRAFTSPHPRPIDPTTLVTLTVTDHDEVVRLVATNTIPPDTQLIMVTHPRSHRMGNRPVRPTITPSGIPVVYAGTPVWLYPDGTQHATDGSF